MLRLLDAQGALELHEQEGSDDAPALEWAAWLQHHGGKLYYFAVHWNAEDPEDALRHAVVQTARAVNEGRCEDEEEAALRYAYTTLRHRLHRVRAQQEHRQRSESAWGRVHPLLTADDATAEECRRVNRITKEEGMSRTERITTECIVDDLPPAVSRMKKHIPAGSAWTFRIPSEVADAVAHSDLDSPDESTRREALLALLADDTRYQSYDAGQAEIDRLNNADNAMPEPRTPHGEAHRLARERGCADKAVRGRRAI